MSWIESEEFDAQLKLEKKNALGYISDIALVFELAKRLGLTEAAPDRIENDEFAVIGMGKAAPLEAETGIRFGHGCGYANFQVEFYFDENGKLVRHGVWE